MPRKTQPEKKSDRKKETAKSHTEEDVVPNSSDESDSSEGDSPASLSQSDSDSGTQDNTHAPIITLSCLREWDAQKLKGCFDKYVSKPYLKGANVNPKVGVSKLAKIDDFTPWWDDFTRSKSKPSSAPEFTNKDPDSFDSWFDKSHGGGSNSSWLCGPGSSKPSEEVLSHHNTPVEDIEVPSIYNQTPKIKGRRALKRDRKAEKEKTLGKKWFEMRAPEVDDKLRNDMEMIRMRGVLDPKRFYKNNDRSALPKFFQMGTVVDEGSDFYSSRLTKKQRKQTLVEELMADANVRQFNKRKYSEVQQKMRNKKKFKGKKSTAS